jgi:hypothetical protein
MPVPRRTDRGRRGKRLAAGQDGKVEVVVAGKVGHGTSGHVLCTGQRRLGAHRTSHRRSTSELSVRSALNKRNRASDAR